MNKKRVPISRGEFEVFSPLYYIMSYEDYLKKPMYHEIVEEDKNAN